MRVHDALRLARAARRVQDEERVLGAHRDGLAEAARARQQRVEVLALGHAAARRADVRHGHLRRRELREQHVLHGRALGHRLVHDRLQVHRAAAAHHLVRRHQHFRARCTHT